MPGFNIPFSNACHEDGAFVRDVVFDGPSHLRETARSHRYKLELFEPFAGSNSILLFLERCSRPSPEIDEIVIHNAQDEIYRPGKHRWKPIELSFYEVLNDGDPPDKDITAEKAFKFWAEKTIRLRESRIGAVSGEDAYWANAQIDMLNGVGDQVWSYSLYRCWPTKISPSDLSYSDSNLALMAVTLRFDKAFERNNSEEEV